MAKKSYNASYEAIFGGKNKASKVEKKKKKSSRKKDSVVADLLCGNGSKKKKNKKKKGLEKELRKAMKRDVAKGIIGVSVDSTDPDSIRKVFCDGGPGIYYITGEYKGDSVCIMVASPYEFINVLGFNYEIPETEMVGYDMNGGEMVSLFNIQHIENLRIASAGLIGVENTENCSELFDYENTGSSDGTVVIGLQAVSDDGVEVLDDSKEEGDKE